MFQLTTDDIHLHQQTKEKKEVIEKTANFLFTLGFVETGYSEGMLHREQQSSTYLGSGIAIPHGTTTTRHLVKKTGIQVLHYPQGIVWGDDGQLAYLVIGIAAHSDEHLTLLRQLTHVLSEEGVEERLKHIQSAQEIIDLFAGEINSHNVLHFDPSLLLLDIPADSLQTLQALNAVRLKKISAIDTTFITNVIEKQPTYLGQGVWLSDSVVGNKKNAIAISRPKDIIIEQNKPVKLLITISAVDNTVDPVIEQLAGYLFHHQADKLLQADAKTLLILLNEPKNQDTNTTNDHDTISQEFIVINPHGLHTRPGSVLIKVIKAFNSTVQVANLDGTNVPTNATSLMKVVSLGAKQGHRLRFTATGKEANQVLEAIGHAMAAGLGEEKAL